jgi:MYXO-CTERM domain-containing protein
MPAIGRDRFLPHLSRPFFLPTDLGRLIGGDTHNESFVAGANLTAPVPEPSTAVLAVLGLLGLLAWRRRR